jgi:S1-C subfamily serine protease
MRDMEPQRLMRLSPCVVASLLLCIVLVGCSAVHKPSDQVRRASFSCRSAGFTGNLSNTLHQACFLLSGERDLQITVGQSSGASGRFELTGAERSVVNEGFAVGLEPDGYLLTATHLLGPHIRVLGWFDGEFQAKSARLVWTNQSKTLGADLAVIKVAGRVDHCALLGDTPGVGEPGFAAVGYRSQQGKGSSARWMIGFAAGSVLEVTADPAGSPVLLIATDVPLWFGDSGSPLLSGAGQLIGVNCACKCVWGVFQTKRSGLACLPRGTFLRELIARDRAAHPEPNQSHRVNENVLLSIASDRACHPLSPAAQED